MLQKQKVINITQDWERGEKGANLGNGKWDCKVYGANDFQTFSEAKEKKCKENEFIF